MRKAKNNVRLTGRIYEHNLTLRTVQDTSKATYGTEFINGTLDVATDPEGLNIVQVHYSYVTEVTKNGKKNSTFGVLKSIIDDKVKTVVKDGFENATLVRVDSSAALNDFYTNRDGQDTLISAKRVEGGFVSIVTKYPTDESEQNRFECDMLINGTQYVEADPERNIAEDYLVVKGAVFDFRGAIMPMEFIVKSKGGIKYFESLEASSKNLVFTKVWGTIHSETIVTRREEESAFGEPSVKEYERTVREWIITGTTKADSRYEIGDEENGITEDEIKKALADREVYLADVKKRADEYQASKAAKDSVPFGASQATAPAAAGGFNF